MPTAIKWTERLLFLTILLSLGLKFFEPLTGVASFYGVLLFKASVILFFLLYLSWSLTVAPPLQKKAPRTRGLHFIASALWAWEFLWLFIGRTWIEFMEERSITLIHIIPEGILFIIVTALSVERIHQAPNMEATRYYGWILGRTFLIKTLTYLALEPFG